MGKEPSPFNPNAQMAQFLRGLGLRFYEQERVWRLCHPPQGPDFVWTQEELERMWAGAVTAIDLYPFGVPKQR